MRKIIPISFALVLVCLASLALLSVLPSPGPSLTFTGYSNDGRRAVFSFVNPTRDCLEYRPRVQIQLATSRGWTNYQGPADVSWHCIVIANQGPWTSQLEALLPVGQHRWRAQAHYESVSAYNSGWYIQLERVLHYLHMGHNHGEKVITSAEFVK